MNQIALRVPRAGMGFAALALLCSLAGLLWPSMLRAADVTGNTRLESLAQAKRLLLREIYPNHRQTLYCGATFSSESKVSPPEGFHSTAYRNRMTRLEWEHAVPAAQFGRTFSAWTGGDSRCRRHDGSLYKGRRCAEKISREFRRMQADMHNFFPAIGAVNAARSSHAAASLPDASPAFGTCGIKIVRRKMEPPDAAKGPVARASLYMAAAYPRFRLPPEQKMLFQTWNAAYPPDAWECLRERRIRRLQGNGNPFVQRACAR